MAGECGAIVFEDSARGLPKNGCLVIALPGEPMLYARRLYATLRELDARLVQRIVVEEPPPGVAWDALRDRLARAAARPDETR